MKRKLSQTISNLLQRKLHFGTRRQWFIGITLVGTVAFAFVAFSPGIQTAKWHFEHPNTVSCPTFTAHIPPLWTANRTNPLEACLYGFTISKSAAAFGTMLSKPISVYISPIKNPAGSYSKEDHLQILRRMDPDATSVPYRLNSTFTSCFLTQNIISAPGVEFKPIDVYCVDQKQKITLDYNGTRSALHQVARMIH